MGKIDIHLHLGIETVTRPISIASNGEKTTYSQGNTPHDPIMKISSSKEMIPHLMELGISNGIILSGGEEIGTGNSEIQKAAMQVPGVYKWMCNLDPKDSDSFYDRLLKYKKLGAVGIGELAWNQWIGSPMVEKLFEVAENLNMPVLFHLSPEEGFNYGIADKPGLPLLEEALKKYPKLTFIGHSQPFWHEISGGASEDLFERNSWGRGKVLEGGRIPYLLDKYENLYGDLSANSGGCAIMRDEQFGLKFLEKYQDRLMFGTDMTNTEMVFPLGKWLDEKLIENKISKESYDKICRKNAERIFGLWK